MIFRCRINYASQTLPSEIVRDKSPISYAHNQKLHHQLYPKYFIIPTLHSHYSYIPKLAGKHKIRQSNHISQSLIEYICQRTNVLEAIEVIQFYGYDGQVDLGRLQLSHSILMDFGKCEDIFEPCNLLAHLLFAIRFVVLLLLACQIFSPVSKCRNHNGEP